MVAWLPSWPFYFHYSLTYMTLCSKSGSLALPRYITLVENNPIVRMWVTWLMNWIDMTWHDNAATFMCMFDYSSAGWWMSSWCIIASHLHGEVHGVFDGPWFAWRHFSMFFLACMFEDRAGSSICEGAFLSHLFTSHVSFIHPLVKLSFCMFSLFSSHSSTFHVRWHTCTSSRSWWDKIKSKTS